MSLKSISLFGLIVAVGAGITATPASAGFFDIFSPGGFETGPAPEPIVGPRYPALDARQRWAGSPGWQRVRPAAWSGPQADLGWEGPGRHAVCSLQDRYDRHERYVGSRQICWIEAR